MNTSKDSIRILSIVPYKIFPAVMGGQKGVALFYKYFSQLVSFACYTVKSNESKESYTILNELSNGQSRYINPFLFFKIKKIAVENECTHILFEHPYYAWLIILLTLFTKQKLIIHSHNIESERFKSIGKWWWKILWFYEQLAYRTADYVWFKTDEDKQYAHLFFKLKIEKCSTIPYGTEVTKLPSDFEISEARNEVLNQYNISDNDTLILFNGSLNYKPNLDALMIILKHINPLLNKAIASYKILICGKGLPPEMNELKDYLQENIIYCGFVIDIDLYFKACDIFLNPLLDGGGIKTKLVEALGFGKKCVSSVNGAIGIDEACTGGRLKIVADKDWVAYSNAIFEMNETEIKNDHQDFYNIFSWPHIAEKAIRSIC
jgi:glycosyltransferase involved in cell wall biosynthesis